MLTQSNPQVPPVCGQCKFFDNNACSAKLERWIYDSSVLLKKEVRVSQAACADKFVEVVPF